jgi:Holliday junction resolvasome RuvABC endonuclease subunit
MTDVAKNILAIDASLTSTAVIQGGADTDSYSLAVFSSLPCGKNAAGRVARYDDLVARIMDWIGDVPIAAVYIEGYSYNSHQGGEMLGEYGGILRWHLVELTPRIFEVAPSTLKKFCTGVGKGTKDMIAAHLTKRYGVLLSSNDEYDAYGLYRLGLVAEGLAEPEIAAQREAVDTVLGIQSPKKKKPAPMPAPTPQPSMF